MLPFIELHYMLRIEPDLAHFSFKGDLSLEMVAASPTREVVLNALDLDVAAITLRDPQGDVPVDWQTDAARETLSLALGRPARGKLRLSIRYGGVINDRMAGFYRSAVRTGDTVQWIGITQFQESDARRAFPCFDHPAAKGIFDIELVVDEGLTAVSNGPAIDIDPLGDGRKRVRFGTTPIMSTYLVFWGIGDFETIQDNQDSRVRLVMPPGQIDQGRMGLSFGRRSLAFCENVFGIPYPLPKLDLIAVPDFAFGAMENWGAITFRENLLLDDPAATSKAGRARICEVVAHEITHQWFGNLATPADWSFLWLNESFATYFGYGIVDHFHPEWGTWDQFLSGQTHTALDRDALLDTFPMEIPGGEHIVINSSTAPLIYSKGASILRQIHAYIGEERFRAGLRRYLDRFAYATADSSDFWAAFDAEADEPVSGIMKAWVAQKGFPLVTVRREGPRLVLTQTRFSYLAQEASSRWPIPVLLRCFYGDGTEDVRSILFADGEMSVDVGEAVAWKLNDGQTGFYRVHCLDADNRNALGRLAREGVLSEPDRWGLQEDEFALVLSGAVSLKDYLAFVRYLEKDTAYLPAVGLARNLFRIFKAAHPDRRQPTRSLASRICRHILETIGFAPRPQEPHTIAALRDQLLWHGAVYGLEPVLSFTAERFDHLISGGQVPPDILQGVLQAGAFQGGSRAFGQLTDRLERSGSEHERLAILHAFGSLRDADGIRECFDYVVEKVPARNRFVPLVAMADNPYGAPILWEVFSESQDRLADFHPLLYERVLAAVITGCGVHEPHRVKPFFEAHLAATDDAGDVIRLSLERLDILLRLQRAA